jgi:hypothetical protein
VPVPNDTASNKTNAQSNNYGACKYDLCLPVGSESFVFQIAIQKFKDQDI